jgi:hypothetical protein
MILITMDTLALPGKALGERLPSVEGKRLWGLLFSQYSGSIILIADARDDKDHMEHWLRVNNLKPSMIDYATDNTAESKVLRATQLRNAFGGVVWFVDIDPHSARLAIEEGLPTLLAIAPSVPRIEWRSDKKTERRTWDDLVGEVDQQKIIKAEATWGEFT